MIKKKLITSIKPSSGSGDSLIKWIDSMKISHFNTAPFSAKQSRRKQKAESRNGKYFYDGREKKTEGMIVK